MSELLSRTDLDDPEVRKDCLHELDRLAADHWVRRWGGALRELLNREPMSMAVDEDEGVDD